jgi:serine phosphatase RsbU (regulator of sigma subunit)
LLLLFTDGLYEVDSPGGGEFGQERLLRAVRQRAKLPAEQLLDELLAEVRHFGAMQEFEDDVCLVGVELRPTGIHF